MTDTEVTTSPPAEQEVEEKKDEQKSTTTTTTTPPKPKNLGVKYLAEYYNQDHHRYITDAKEEAPKQKQKLAEYVDYPICLIKHYNYQGEFSHRSMTITSTHLKAALKEMIPSYPSVSFQTSEVSLDAPFHVLYHYKEELKELKAEEDKKKEEQGGESTVLADHLETLLGFLDSEFNETEEKVNNLVPEGFISFDVLWTLFKPGHQIFTTMLGQPRVLRIKSFTIQTTMCGPIAAIGCAAVCYNGKLFGEMETSVSISSFVGTEKILNLNVFPFDFHPEKAAMTERLVERGRKYVSMQGINCMEYTGNAVKMTSCGPMKVYSSGRVMIDAATHAQFQPNSGYRNLKALSTDDKKCGGSSDYDYDYDTSDDEYEYSDDEDDGSYDRCSPAENADFADVPANNPRGKKSKPLLTLTDEQCLLCTSLCWGFSLGSKEWYQFFLDKLRPVRWNPLSFEKLVLPPSQKDLVRSLVESHIDPLKTKFDDFVVNKGKGLISVLHGPPGVGKTMTAETVAEFTKSPLYTISAGSLGTTPEGMEKSLDKILRLCSIWNAVLLLDEADVYLEERSPHDIKRNALVSIFLRLLEYYEGILFLTTNRVKTFDNAFQSRIHLALSFKDLSKEARSKVWQNFLEKIEVGCKRTIKMSDSDYQYLAGVELNGREIKNAARTALSLADSNGEVLEMRHVKTVLDQVEAFKRDVMLEKSN